LVFTSDNGGLSVREGPHTPATSNAPLRAGKGYLYEGGIRVPLIVRWPGAVRPGVCDTPVLSTDLYPTVLEVAGLGPGAGRASDGSSLLPLLTGKGEVRREALFWHYPHYSNQGGTPGGAVRLGRHKLIESYEDGRVELYDLADDVGEKHDLAPADPTTARRLRGLLHDWRRSVGARMPTPNPRYDPSRAAKQAAPPGGVAPTPRR
jgi:arylsulfatase A